MTRKVRYRYSVAFGPAGCYRPDSSLGPYEAETRRELRDDIAIMLSLYGLPKRALREAKLRSLWSFIKRNGSSSASFNIQRGSYMLSFVGLTEQEALELEQREGAGA